MIGIKSYSDVNGVRFGSTQSDFVAAFGEPTTRRTNREREQELHYTGFIARFDGKTQLLREFTLLPRCEALINGTVVEWEISFLRKIQQSDPDLVDVLGFIVSLKLGLAFTGFHDCDYAQMAIHAFQLGDWDMLKHRMKPFCLQA